MTLDVTRLASGSYQCGIDAVLESETRTPTLKKLSYEGNIYTM